MKFTKKLLTLSPVIASVCALGSNVACSKNNEFDLFDLSNLSFIPSTPQFVPGEAEKSGVTEGQAKSIYINSVSKNFNIMKEDLYYYSVHQYTPVLGMKSYLGFKIEKIDLNKSLIDYDFIMHSVGHNSTAIVIDVDYQLKVKVKNAPIEITNLTSWKINLGKQIVADLSQLGDEEIVGSISGYINFPESNSNEKITYSGKEFTINKKSVKPTQEKELAEFNSVLSHSFESFNSYYLQKLQYKPS